MTTIVNDIYDFFCFSPHLAPATCKRELEEADGPAAKVAKTENGS